MKPWQFPSGQWLDLECIQTVSVIMEQPEQQTADAPVTYRRWFSLTLAFQTQPLVIQVFSHHEGNTLTDEQWLKACASLNHERDAVLNAWRGSDAIELVFDASSVTDAITNVTPEGYELELTVLIANDVAGTALVNFIQQLPQLQPVVDEVQALPPIADVAVESTDSAATGDEGDEESDEWK